MKFLNLETGHTFDGIWKNSINYNDVSIPQTKGYIYWFPNEQSTGIVHTMPICVLTDENKPLNISIEENDTFVFVKTTENLSTIDGYTFIEPEFSYTYTTEPQELDKYYAHVFNIACKSEIAGEHICKVTLDEDHYFRVGVDLYGEYEPARINLSNMGIELPEMIQKAIYDVDPHEDVKDNIVINRKFKELLINYWDIIANKGSYSSLVNSLKWFEWNNIEVKEIWKHLDAGKFIFDDRQIMSLNENKIKDIQNNFIKTSYIAIYCSLYDELDEYDSELNPVISKAVLKWSQEDLRLKMALLAQFFGIYFMPIHLSLKHAVIEDKVFTNTIKSIVGCGISREDSFGDFSYVECNIKDNQRFALTNVRAQVTNETIFGIKDYESNMYFGVDTFPTNVVINDINVFANQYYTGPGVIIPIQFVLSNQYNGDFLKHTIVKFDNEILNFYDIINVVNNKITINFNLLLKTAKSYEYAFTFITAYGKTLTKTIKFNVSEPDNMSINVYKVISKNDSNGFTYDDFNDTSISNFMFRIQKSSDSSNHNYHLSHLPYMNPTHEKFAEYKGVKLNRTIILSIKNADNIENIRALLSQNYLEFTRYSNDNTLKYIVYVSKRFYGEVPSELQTNDDYEIIRNDLGFYPQFHKLQLINGNSLNDYTINQYEAICCAPVTISKNIIAPFKYGQSINESEWEFVNISQVYNNVITHNSSQQPFISKSKYLEPGFYSIKFRYKLSDENSTYNEINIGSAFKVIHI